jgi:ubiquinone/menaquinone biosynthesis C-methylase UbiE
MRENLFYWLMFTILKIRDRVAPVGERAKKFGIQQGQTVIDYGCGVGSYIVILSELVGTDGNIYAVDNHPFAIRATQKKIKKYKLQNSHVILSTDKFHSGIKDNSIADVVLILDMLHLISDVDKFLLEIHRLTKSSGYILIEIEHMADEEIKKKVERSKRWIFTQKIDKYLKFTPVG